MPEPTVRPLTTEPRQRKVDVLFASAQEALQRGDLTAALDGLRSVLDLDPLHGMGNYWLGLLLRPASPDQALAHFQLAAEQCPALPDCHIELALALQALGRSAEAERSLRKAREIAPDYAAAQSRVADKFVAEKKFDQAIEAYQRALIVFPQDPAALAKLANLCSRRNRWPEALAAWKRLLELRPECQSTHLAFAEACFTAEAFDLAAAAFERVLELDPNCVAALVNLGITRQKQGAHEQAFCALQRAIALAPNQAAIHKALGDVHRDREHWTDAEGAWRRAVELKPDYADAWQNLGLGLERLQRLHDALACHRRVVELKPSDPTAHRYLGMVLQDLGEFEPARAAYTEAHRLAPKDPQVHWQIFSLMATRGEFPEAWIEHEWRWQLPARTTPKHAFPQPSWDGSELAGRRILLHAEQGFGDTIQAVRYLPRVQQRGGRILLWVPPDLIPLLRTMPGVEEIFSQLTPDKQFDLHLPLMSLPLVFQTTLESIPSEVPYIPCDSHPLQQAGSSPIQPSNRPKVGLVWCGSRSQPNDRRPIPFQSLLPLFDIPNVQFYSLQAGPASSDLAQFPAIVDLSPHLTDFAATAVLIQQLDLVITIDTAVAHLAGALGKPVWLLLAFAPDWRWMRNRSDSPWYPTMRLFRQPAPGAWQPVIADVCDALRALAAGADAWKPILAQALAHHQNRQLIGAEQGYLEVLKLNPDQPDALRLLGVILRERGDYTTAETRLRRASELRPNCAFTQHDLGLLYSELGRFDAAIVAYSRATHLNPDFADAFHNLGNACFRAKQFAKAEQAYRHALELNPTLAQAHYNLGLIADERRAPADAIPHYQRAIELQPDHIDACQNLGVAWKELGKLDEAEHALRIVLRLQPQHVSARVTLAALFAARNQWSQAEQLCRSVTQESPGAVEAWMNLGIILQAQNKIPQALDALRRAHALAPDHPDAEFNLGIAELLAGHLAAGWRHYEARWRTANPIFSRSIPAEIPQWKGEPLRGKTIVVHAEQGYGDAIQFARYLPILAADGARVVFECPDPLVRLMHSLAGIDGCIRRGDPWPHADFQSPLMSLPLWCRTDLTSIPARVPYLAGPTVRQSDRPTIPRPPIAGTSGLTVGLVRAGSPHHANDARRSVPLEYLRPIANSPGVQFYNLHGGSRQPGHAPFAIDLVAHDFAAMADILQQIDLLISVDTAAAHLAGALAKPVWLLLPFAPDWRWLLERSDSPWYPTMRLFRQPYPGDWQSVMNAVAAELRKTTAPDQ